VALRLVAVGGSTVNSMSILWLQDPFRNKLGGWTPMWCRDSGLAAAAALAVYAWIYLVPGTELAAGLLRDIVTEQRSKHDRFDLIGKELRGSSLDTPAGTDTALSVAALLQHRGPDLLDGVLPTGPDGL